MVLESECSGLDSQHLVEPFGVETDHDLVIHHDRRGRPALVLAHQFADKRAIAGDVLVLKRDASLREVCLGPGARRSTRLAEDDHVFRGHIPSPDEITRCPPRMPPGIMRIR